MYQTIIEFRKNKANYAIESASKMVPEVIKKNTEYLDYLIKDGFQANSAVFMDTLATKASKLTTHKQSQFFKNLSDTLNLENPEFFKNLNVIVNRLTQSKIDADDFVKFNTSSKKLIELASKNDVNLKPFFKL